MVKHIIMWQLKDELTKEEKIEVKKGIKEALEALVGQVPGLQSADRRACILQYRCDALFRAGKRRSPEGLRGSSCPRSRRRRQGASLHQDPPMPGF